MDKLTINEVEVPIINIEHDEENAIYNIIVDRLKYDKAIHSYYWISGTLELKGVTNIADVFSIKEKGVITPP